MNEKDSLISDARHWEEGMCNEWFIWDAKWEMFEMMIWIFEEAIKYDEALLGVWLGERSEGACSYEWMISLNFKNNKNILGIIELGWINENFQDLIKLSKS